MQPITSEEFEEIYKKIPRLCVDVLIKTDEGVLLTLRTNASFNGFWHIPGGTVQFKETLHEAVHRVSKKELGLDVDVQKQIGYIEYFSEEKERGYGYAVGIVFLCVPKSLDVQLNEEAIEANFFTTLPEKIIEEQKVFLENYL